MSTRRNIGRRVIKTNKLDKPDKLDKEDKPCKPGKEDKLDKEDKPGKLDKLDKLDDTIIQDCFDAFNKREMNIGNMIDNLEKKLYISDKNEEKEKLKSLISKMKNEYLQSGLDQISIVRDRQDEILFSKKISDEHLIEIISLDLEPGKKLSEDPTFMCWFESKRLWLRKSKEPIKEAPTNKNIFKTGNRGNKPLTSNIKRTLGNYRL